MGPGMDCANGSRACGYRWLVNLTVSRVTTAGVPDWRVGTWVTLVAENRAEQRSVEKSPQACDWWVFAPGSEGVTLIPMWPRPAALFRKHPA
jgi:hypothetical protein